MNVTHWLERRVLFIKPVMSNVICEAETSDMLLINTTYIGRNKNVTPRGI
jgi:hypothetical protein